MDNNDIVLEAATSAIFTIGVKYRKATFNDKKQLREDRDKVFSAYSAARLKLLEDEVMCTEDDVKEIKEIRTQIQDAAKTQGFLIAITRLTKFLIVL